MKKTQKLLSLFLALVMALSMMVPSVLAADFTDVPETHQYYDAIQSLVARGIIEGIGDGTFAPDATIKRSEFAKMVVYAIGMGNTTSGTAVETGFPDVAADHWAAGVIKAAYDLGIINGYDDGTFKPDENVTYEQAIKMAVCAKSAVLGQLAENNGGYPNGYISLASSYQFLKNIIATAYNEAATRGMIAQLIENMLKVDLSESFGDLPTIDSNQMEEVKGQIVAVSGVSLLAGDTDTLTSNQIKVLLNNGSTAIYNASKVLSSTNDARSLLGKMIVFYYEEDYGADAQAISSMSEQKNRNYEITLGVDEIDTYTNTGIVYYDSSNNEKKLSISSNATIMYNGSLYTTTNFATLLDANINKAGSIRFLCTEGEGSTADVIFFTSYTNWYVTSVTASSKLVYGEYYENGSLKTGSITIDDETKKKTITITKDGNAGTFSSIAKNQILSISESEDGRFMEVLISSTTPSGSVTALTRDEKKLTIASKEYSFASDVAFGDDIKVGANLKLYLDAFGKVAKYDFQTSSVSYTYGYLMQIKNIGSAMSSNVKLQVLNLNTTSTKTPAELALADNVYINGKLYTTASDYNQILALLKETAEYYDGTGNYDFAADAVYQPFKYSLSGGAVSNMLIGTQDVTATDADLKVDRSRVDEPIKCTTNNTTLASRYTLNSSTKVLYVPDNETDRADNTKYSIRSGTNSGFVKDETYSLVMVDTNSSNAPAVVIVYGDATAGSTEWKNNLPMVVTDMAEVADGYRIVLQGSGSEVTYLEETATYYNQISKGDVVRVAVDSDNKIEALEIVLSAVEAYNGNELIRTTQYEARDSYKQGATLGSTRGSVQEGEYLGEDRAQMELMAGVAYAIEDASMDMVLDYPTAGEEWTEVDLEDAELLRTLNLSSAKVMAVNFRNGAVRNIEVGVDYAQIATYSSGAKEAANKLFIYRASGTVKLVVIYRAE